MNMQEQVEECAGEVEDVQQVSDQGLQKHAELEEKVKKLQQEKAREEGRTGDEDVIYLGHKGRRRRSLMQNRSNQRISWKTTNANYCM